MTSRSKLSPNPLLSAALAYAERGWRVFPLHPRDKTPIPSNGFKASSTDRSQILQWWQAFPDANIGIATGDPFDVLDLDSPAAVPTVRELLGRDYRHAGPVVSTGKGWHFYFAATGNGNRAGLLQGRIDYRGSGGYVVGPPSIHPSGRVYRWDEARDYRTELPVAPDELLNILVKPRAAVEHGAIARSDGTILTTTRAEIARERPNILTVAEELGLPLYIKGLNYVTNCCFHDDPGPSMVLYTGQNKFFCYGCEAHGDSLDLQARRDMTGKIAVIP